MPRKVSQLDLRNRSSVSNSHQVVVTDPVSYSLYRVPVTQFRGASVFTSTNNPTTSPENPLITEYVDGDVFIQDTQEGQKIYIWNAVNNVWDSSKKLNGIRLLSAINFPQEISLDLRSSNLVSNIAYDGDYYLNKTADLLFGPYSPVSGFKFGTTDFSGYMGLRQPITHTFNGDDVIGYDNPSAYLNAYLTSAATDKQKLVAKRPIHGDRVHIKLEGDDGHGGWVYTFKTSIPATGATLLQNYNILLGTNIAGDLTTVKTYYREAKTWNETSTPVQNDKKYRKGDNVFVVNVGVLYYGYKEGLPANTTDLAVLFEGQTVLAGSSLKNAYNSVAGSWGSPTSDDGKYKEGDFIFTKNLGTPRIHGPYKASSSDDLTAWPLYAVLRPPVTHSFTHSTTLPVSYTGDYPEHDDVMIVDKDLHKLVYTAGKKEKISLTEVSINYTTKALTWGNTYRHLHPTQVHFSAAAGYPSKDDLIYYNGDIIRNKVGDLFKYIEGAATNNDAFELLPNLKANVIHVVSNANGSYTPPTTNGNAAWGGATVQDNDTLEVRCTAAGSTKIVWYTADVDEATNTITWKDRRSKYGQRHFESGDVKDPTKDNNKYTTGDYIVTASGREFKYDENSADGWAFQRWVRAPQVFEATKPITYTPQVTDVVYGDPDFTQMRLQVGDVYSIKVQGSTTDKRVELTVIEADTAINFSDRLSVHPTRVFTVTSASRPNRDDSKYSKGDFLDNPQTGWRYGPYVEGMSSDELAWPDFKKLTSDTTAVNLRHNPNARYEQFNVVINDGLLYEANNTIDGTTTPVPFVEGTTGQTWKLISALGRVENKDNASLKPTLYVKNGLLTLNTGN